MVSKQVQQQRLPCSACGGTGQLNQFKGESRFLLTAEECPICCGFGYVQEEKAEGSQEKKTDKEDGKG